MNRSSPPLNSSNSWKKNGRAQVYGIYFDFGSDVLRPESQTVLDQIAQVMREHPDWKLGVEGHTDNIGGDAYNLDLSNRRATTVKQVLDTRYHVDPERLSPAGFGSTRPVDSNDTLEGRARNRRVELVRE
jgi:OOP family OmpA-OmpF porin